MIEDNFLEAFLERNRIDATTWSDANIEWSALREIGDDHEAGLTLLRDSAEIFARLIQRFDRVHSVRWRVKETEHLLEKIVRKRAEGITKYLAITRENYFETVTDLVGIRALHLYKDDCLSIDQSIKGLWTLAEQPVAYVREGDPVLVLKQLAEQGFVVKNHPAGYRSIHYIVESRPVSRRLTTEIQVRTIFEEGWSEIDHNIRYPNLSGNALVEYFLTIFNRMAGSADEMGAFVRGLSGTLRDMEGDLIAANAEKEQSGRTVEAALAQLENANNKDKVSAENIATLRAEISKLRADAIPVVGLMPQSLRSGSNNLGFGLSRSAAEALADVSGRGIIGGGLLDSARSSLRRPLTAAETLADISGQGIIGGGLLDSARVGLRKPITVAEAMAGVSGQSINAAGLLDSARASSRMRTAVAEAHAGLVSDPTIGGVLGQGANGELGSVVKTKKSS